MGAKKQKFHPDIPEWELDSSFEPSKVNIADRDERWVNYRGEVLLPPFQTIRAE